MSFIHYKLITNKNYEKVTFDGVSLSVGELKKLVLEKKFRKHTGPPGSATGVAQSKKSSDVDLEVRCVDSDLIYQKDSDLIPKNSRVQINRVVRNLGPAIAGGTITSTQKENELLASMRIKQQQKLQEITGTNTIEDITKPLSIKTQFSSHVTSSPSSMNASPNENYKSSPRINQRTSIYDNLEENSSTSSSLNEQSKSIAPSLPPLELLCPFEDTEKSQRHLMKNAVIAPCCGYFICCEDCIRDRLKDKAFVECPRDDCLQEITAHHRLTPQIPIRQKIKEFLIASSLPQDTKFPSSLFLKKQSTPMSPCKEIASDASKEISETAKPQTQVKSNIKVKYVKKLIPLSEQTKLGIEAKTTLTPPQTTSLSIKISPNPTDAKERSSISPVSSKSDITSPCDDQEKTRRASVSRRSNSNLSRVSSSRSDSRSRSRSRSRSSRSSSRSYLSKVSSNEIRLKSSRSNSFSSTPRQSRSRTRSTSPIDKSKRNLPSTHSHSLNSISNHAQSYYFNNNTNSTSSQAYFGNQPSLTQVPQLAYNAPPLQPPFLTNNSAHFQTPNNSFQNPNPLQHMQQPGIFNQNSIMPSMQQQYSHQGHIYNGQMVNYAQHQHIPFNQMINEQQFNSNVMYPFEANPSMLNTAYPSNQMYPAQWNQSLTLTPITNQLQYKQFTRVDPQIPLKRSYTRSRSLTRSRSRSYSRSRSPFPSSSSKNRSKKRSRSRSRTRSRSRSRSVNRNSKRIYKKERSPKYHRSNKHVGSGRDRDRKMQTSNSSHRSKDYKDKYSNSSSRKQTSNKRYSPFNETNGKNRDKTRRSRSRSRDRDQRKFSSYTRNGDYQRSTEKSYSSKITSPSLINDISCLSTKKIETNQKTKENETILIKDTITKRAADDDDELEEGEEKWDDVAEIKQNELTVMRNSSNSRSFWPNNNKHENNLRRSGSFKAPCIQITLPNIVSGLNSKNSEMHNSGESSNTSKNRFVFLFKGDYATEKTTSTNKITYNKPIETSDNEIVISDEEIDIKVSTNENETMKTTDNTNNYYCVPTVIKTVTPKLNVPEITRANSMNKAKKPIRRVHLAHEIASPVFKNSLLSRLSIGSQSQQIVPSAAPVTNIQPDEQIKTAKLVEIKANVQTSATKPLERNQSFQDENGDFLDISIGQDQL